MNGCPAKLALSLCLWGLLSLGAVPAEAAGATDPVVQEIVQMLEAKISEPVIAQWLETAGKRPAAVSSQDLIELKRAGASDELLGRLLGPAPEKPAAAPSPQPAPPTPQPAPPAPRLAPASPSGAVSLRVDLQYQPATVEDESPWDLFVYLDGTLLARVEGPVVSMLAKPLVFDGSVTPGPHLVRLVQERHQRRTGGWRHEARVAPVAFPFTLASGEPARLEVRFRQSKLGVRQRDPLSFRATQGDRTVAEAGPVGTDPDSWPLLCEEIEANLTPGKKPALPIRRELERCLRWSALWPGLPGAPTRDEIREELARYDFRPTPTHRAGE